MSIKVMSRVWQDAQVGGSELLVLLALADFSDDDGCNIYPSIRTLAAKVRLTTKQTRRIIHKLVQDELIEVVQDGGWRGGRNFSNEYRIHLHNLERTDILGDIPSDGSTGTDMEGSEVTDMEGSNLLTPMGDDPSYNRNNKSSSFCSSLVERSSSTNDDDDWKQIGEAMHRYGVPLSGYMIEQYKDMLKEFGVTAVLAGLQKAANNSKVGLLNYVRPCVASAFAGALQKQDTATMIVKRMEGESL